MNKPIILALLLLTPFALHADLKIFACEPEWAAVATELGGDKISVSSATNALQDPHYIQARPSLISKVRRADLIVCSGAQLEIGWLPMLLRKGNNPNVVPGSPGFLEASEYVKCLDVTLENDRSQGDVHPQGNPHIQTNPHGAPHMKDLLVGQILWTTWTSLLHMTLLYAALLTIWFNWTMALLGVTAGSWWGRRHIST